MIIKYKSMVIDTASIGIKTRQYFKSMVDKIKNRLRLLIRWIVDWCEIHLGATVLIVSLFILIVMIFIVSKLEIK